MANPTHIQEFGNQLAVLFDDGTRKLAVPTMGSMWIINGSGGGPGPGPSGFKWPYSLASSNMNNGHPEDNFKTPQRPNHEGMDFGYGGAAGEDPPMPAAAAGTVVVSGVYQGYGYANIIDHGNGIKTLYGHMVAGSLTKAVGDTVAQGDTIGIVGNTGPTSTGQHLHLETWVNDVKIDPLIFMAEHNPNDEFIYA